MNLTRTRIAAASAVLVVLLAGLIPADAATARWIKRTARYEGPSELSRRTSRSDPTCTGGQCALASDGKLEIGGIKLEPLGGRGSYSQVTVEVADDVNLFGQVKVEYCENLDTNNACDDTDPNHAHTCLAPGQRALLRRVSKKSSILVFVDAAYNCSQYIDDPGAGQGGGTTGKITVRFRVR